LILFLRDQRKHNIQPLKYIDRAIPKGFSVETLQKMLYKRYKTSSILAQPGATLENSR